MAPAAGGLGSSVRSQGRCRPFARRAGFWVLSARPLVSGSSRTVTAVGGAMVARDFDSAGSGAGVKSVGSDGSPTGTAAGVVSGVAEWETGPSRSAAAADAVSGPVMDCFKSTTGCAMGTTLGDCRVRYQKMKIPCIPANTISNHTIDLSTPRSAEIHAMRAGGAGRSRATAIDRGGFKSRGMDHGSAAPESRKVSSKMPS
jgi:hypothetical protein